MPARATPGARVDDSPAVGGEFWGASTATPLRDMDDDMDAYFEDLGAGPAAGRRLACARRISARSCCAS